MSQNKHDKECRLNVLDIEEKKEMRKLGIPLSRACTCPSTMRHNKYCPKHCRDAGCELHLPLYSSKEDLTCTCLPAKEAEEKHTCCEHCKNEQAHAPHSLGCPAPRTEGWDGAMETWAKEKELDPYATLMLIEYTRSLLAIARQDLIAGLRDVLGERKSESISLGTSRGANHNRGHNDLHDRITDYLDKQTEI